MNAEKIKEELFSIAQSGKKEILSRFFKTGKGEYGEGDLFIGVTVPQQRQLVKRHKQIPLEEIEKLLCDNHHECRLTGLFFLAELFGKTKNEQEKEFFYRFYLKNLKAVNSWDLVDLTAPQIVGAHLLNKDRERLYELAASSNFWEQRIAIVSTYSFIKKGEFSDTFRISDMLLTHPHDLIQKAVGWMLREVGKRNYEAEREFLTERYKKMPRTMLRYAIEKFEEKERLAFLKGEIE
ncbi:MAG: DNA alkylation repair protein [Prevotellaceae bacterium]|jgi:3-methyladenine DNA glycosylase AlkD|nr:DNA alkylation repair protein [Prevotellaceae bacterium]